MRETDRHEQVPTMLRYRRLLRPASAVLGTVLLVVALGSAVHATRASARADVDAALVGEASTSAAALAEYFDRARSLNLLLAQDSALRRFEPGPEAPDADQTALLGSEAAVALTYLEQLYPGRISEACLIDNSGTELARVVRGVVAPEEELSTEEAKAPFFAPTLGLPEDRVHQSAPYLSPDTDVMVISNSTPLVSSATGEPWGLVHFEVSLDSFQPGGPDARRQGFASGIVDARTGEVVLAMEDGAALLEAAGPATLKAMVGGGDDAGGRSATNLGGHRAGVALVPRSADNVNEWAVITVATTPTRGWTEAVGPAPIAMSLAALFLLGLVGFQLRARQRELRLASLSDELTGLPNRRLLADRLEQRLLLDRRRGSTSAVLLIDLDRFKEVNDTLGHRYGDALLQQVADRLRGASRDYDTVARLGGDEFAIVLADVSDAANAERLARRCLETLHEPFVVDGIRLGVEASLGIALAPHHGRDGHALLRAADVAMYTAKENRTGVAVYNETLDVHTPTRLALLGDLRRALQEDELFLEYQPKVNLVTDAVLGVEALVRWAHPVRGLVAPTEFIPVAEGTGLIVPLTVRTLELACAQAKAWRDEGTPLQIAVNLSPRCLLEAGFPDIVAGILGRHGVPAQLLRLEVTESTIMSDPARAMTVLLALRDLGVSLSIDDFGTGYSSMSYLKNLPVDELKIDQSFVLDMLRDVGNGVLVRSSIDLGHNLGLAIVAEGVEDEATLAALAALGCDFAQGFHLARPMAAEAVSAWVSGRPDDAVRATDHRMRTVPTTDAASRAAPAGWSRLGDEVESEEVARSEELANVGVDEDRRTDAHRLAGSELGGVAEPEIGAREAVRHGRA